MSVILADIDATCAALGYYDGQKYYAEPDALQCLKHLIWILRRDLENHEYRRHLGRSEVLKTDLVPMLIHYIDDDEMTDVLIRLLIILTNPTPLLYRDGIPKDGTGRKIYMELIDILQNYKSSFTSDEFWNVLTLRLHKVLEVDWALRSEDQNLLIERILVLTRNVLKIPSNPDMECRADNDASLHDEIIWALHQSGMLDLVLYILSSTNENQYNLHAIEIVCLLYKEQTVESLADASLQRSVAEKYRDEQELVAARKREKQKHIAHPPSGRHSRFGGTYVVQNYKSVSDKDVICHQSLERAVSLDFDREKIKQKRSFRYVNEENEMKRRSAFSVRLCLREFCIEILNSGYNNFVNQIRRQLDHSANTINQDDSYLLWAIRFFMEFNRLSEFQLELVSESLSVQCFHWVLMRIQGHLDMMNCDKKRARLWSKRLHIAIQTFRELLLSLIALQKQKDEKSLAVFDMLQNNICYVLEYRETVLYLLMNYNETHSTKAYLRDVVEMANIFIKIMEKFCKDPVVVQDKKRHRKKKNKKSTVKKSKNKKDDDENENIENLEDKWAGFATEIASVLTENIQLPEENQPIPFDATSDKSIDDQKEDCMLRIYRFLREEKFEQAIVLLRSAREVWPENDYFGSSTSSAEDELMLLREIYLSNLGKVEKDSSNDVMSNEENEENSENEQNQEDEDEEEDEDRIELVEKDFRFEDFAKRLLNPKVVRACTLVLSDWEKISTKTLKSAVTILHRIAFGCKCSAMLFQAVLFRIFQQVFHAPKDDHHEELRRLGTYVVRKFIEIAPNNPKIYAELLFYKTLKEANDIETGYTDDYVGNVKGAWSEEQENELQMLFEENQKNPESDKDVIDWILDNLIDKTRTRRAVLKKLREMGLIFKAPTKKSVSAAAKKNLWQHEEDEQLRRLYDEYRLEEDCLDRILEVLRDKHSKNNIIKRMITLGLIADKSEILPSKKQKKRKSRKNTHAEGGDFSEDGNNSVGRESFGDGENSRDSLQRNNKSSLPIKKKKTKRTTKANSGRKSTNSKKSKKQAKNIKTPLHVENIKSLLSQIDERYQEAINWLKDCLTDAAEDFEELPEDEDDGVPLVPLLDIQTEAMDNPEFKKVLITLGIQPPTTEMEKYWRIPIHLNAADLKMRVDILNGTYIEHNNDGTTIDKRNENDNNDDNDDKNHDDNINGNENIVDEDTSTSLSSSSDDDEEEEDDDSYENIMKKRREQFDNLMFNRSDNEDEYRPPLRIKEKPQKKMMKKENSNSNKKRGKFNIDDMIKTNEHEKEEEEEEEDNDPRDRNVEDNTENLVDFDSENLRLRLAELTDDSDASGAEEDMRKKEIQPSTSIMKRSRIRHNVIDSDSSDDDDEFKKINAFSQNLADTMRTGEGTSSSVNETEINNLSKNQRNTREDVEFEDEFQRKDNVSQENRIDNDSKPKVNNKRNRFMDDDDDDDDGNNNNDDDEIPEEEVVVKRKKTTSMNDTHRKKMTIIDDEDDDNEGERNVNDVKNNEKVNITDDIDEQNSDGNYVPERMDE